MAVHNYRLNLGESEEEPILLAVKPVSYDRTQTEPSSPSRVHFCVQGNQETPLWFRIHLGHFADFRGLIPRPRLYLDGQAGFGFSSDAAQRPEAVHRVIPTFEGRHICRAFYEGNSLLDLHVTRLNQEEIGLRMKACRKGIEGVLRLGIVPLQTGPREFHVPGESAIQVYYDIEVR